MADVLLLAGALEGAIIGAVIGAVIGLIVGVVKLLTKKKDGGAGK